MRPIDADALFDKLFHAWGTEIDAGTANEFMVMLNDAPTVTLPPNDPLALKETTGLVRKYIVRKADTGEVVEDCFVLRPRKDWVARYAVRAYADMTCNRKLADDLLKWVGEEFPVSSYDPEYARIDQSKIQLKPCPRCGSKGLIICEGPKYYYAECEYCPLELHEIYFSAEEAAAAWNYREEKSNAPLTLEELREMDGEPVYTITLGVESSGRWELCTCEVITACPLHKVLHCVTATGEVTDYELDTYGKTWLAYRSRPEGGAT